MSGSRKITIDVPARGYFRQYVVTHRGVPVGRVRLTGTELAAGELRIVPAYLAIRDVVRRASESLWAIGFLAPPSSPGGCRVPLEAVTRAADLELELRDDETGALIWTDFVKIVERPAADATPVVFARVRLAPATQRAVVGQPVAGIGAGEVPA